MEQRRNAIVELVNREGSLSFVQLKEAFPSVSEMTLRTDLKALDQARRVVRVHGGVKSVEESLTMAAHGHGQLENHRQNT